MDIDVTRKLRPQKAAELAPPNPAPSSPPPAPPTPARPTFFPPPAAPPKPSPPPPDDYAHTIRFVPSTGLADPSSYAPVTLEPDPVTGWLVVMKGMGQGRSLPLGYGIHPVGRGEDQRVSVRFGDKKISRRSHVEVSYDGKGRTFYVSPGRGSTLGYLNGQPVLQPAPLRAGDRIGLGDTELAFVPFCGDAFDWQQAS